MNKFDWGMLSFNDKCTAVAFLGTFRDPDLVIAPDGNPYLYRWYVTPPKGPANVYFHIQVADDPERPLHDHPWDNMSVILAGGYRETISSNDGQPYDDTIYVAVRRPGDVIHRVAKQAHRLELLRGIPYAMTLFMTGPKIHNWGFWYPEGFVSYEQVTQTKDGISIHIHPTKGVQP